MHAASALTILVICACLPASLCGQKGASGPSHRTGALGPAGIQESSGVAVSRRHRGVLWTHNDSGDGPNLYAIDSTGRLLHTFRVAGARAVDWEDIALGPCPAARWPNRSCLYIADTGDNQERRAAVTLYVVPEPDPATREGPPDPTEPAVALSIRYADRPHDAEALVVDSAGDVGIITKGRSGPILRFVVPADVVLGKSVVLAACDTLPITLLPIRGWVTGGAIAPSGRRAVLRTYTELYFFTIAGGRWRLDGPPCHIDRAEPQGEAVDFLDEDTLVLTSERGLAPEGVITVVRCGGSAPRL